MRTVIKRVSDVEAVTPQMRDFWCISLNMSPPEARSLDELMKYATSALSLVWLRAMKSVAEATEAPSSPPILLAPSPPERSIRHFTVVWI